METCILIEEGGGREELHDGGLSHLLPDDQKSIKPPEVLGLVTLEDVIELIIDA